MVAELKAEHEIHKRRFSRNLGVGIALAAFVALIFALSVVKVTQIGLQQGFDHVARPELAVPSE